MLVLRSLSSNHVGILIKACKRDSWCNQLFLFTTWISSTQPTWVRPAFTRSLISFSVREGNSETLRSKCLSSSSNTSLCFSSTFFVGGCWISPDLKGTIDNGSAGTQTYPLLQSICDRRAEISQTYTSLINCNLFKLKTPWLFQNLECTEKPCENSYLVRKLFQVMQLWFQLIDHVRYVFPLLVILRPLIRVLNPNPNNSWDLFQATKLTVN